MTRQLSVLVAAAIPLEEAIRAVGKQSEKVHVQNLLMSVRSKVLEGHSLAQGLQQSGRFPELYIATIAAGERSGHLDLILDQLADYTENRFAMQKKIQGCNGLSDYPDADVFCDCDGADDLCGARYRQDF